MNIIQSETQSSVQLKRWEKRFGITLEIYNEMLVDQNNVCAICKQPETAYDSRLKLVKKLAVDHCHSTGKIRGLLCISCNTKLGWYELSKDKISSYLTDGDDITP